MYLIACEIPYSIGRVGTGSDYAHFYHYGAIPVIDIMHGMQDIVSIHMP